MPRTTGAARSQSTGPNNTGDGLKMMNAAEVRTAANLQVSQHDDAFDNMMKQLAYRMVDYRMGFSKMTPQVAVGLRQLNEEIDTVLMKYDNETSEAGEVNQQHKTNAGSHQQKEHAA